MSLKPAEEWIKDLQAKAKEIEESKNALFCTHKTYDVYKHTYNPDTDTSIKCRIGFNVPKRDAEIIIQSQRTVTDIINNEIVFLKKYEIEESII